MSHVNVVVPLYFHDMDFFKLHSQMNPYLRDRTDSNIMPVSKMENKRWIVCGLEYKNVAFSVKTACTYLLCVMGCPAWPPMGLQGCCIVCCSVADVNSVWGLDLRQTGRQSLSSQQPTSLSATLAVTKSIMFNTMGVYGLLLHPFSLDFFLPSFTALLELNAVFSPGNMPSKEGSFTYLKTLGKSQLHSGWDGIVVFGGGKGERQ